MYFNSRNGRPQTARFVSPFTQEGIWYKANFHTHTTNSDGDATIGRRIDQYREHGYSILAVTDHECTGATRGLSTRDFLVIEGIETHPACPTANPYHLVCLNVPEGLVFPKTAGGNRRIRMVRDRGGEVVVAHPYWCGHNINHLLRLKDYLAVEVYNATCTKIGKGISSVHWDELLDSGRAVSALAVDDVHEGRDVFMGWTMLKMPELNIRAVMEALRTGCFYASCGPVIEDCRMLDRTITVRCSPAAEIHFIGQRAHGRSFFAADGAEITRAEFPVEKSLNYVRVEIVDRRGNRAWTNPMMFHRK